jgi:uncharacterized protein involved in exopolysaccharide biosynthesis
MEIQKMNFLKENAVAQEYDLKELFFCIWAHKLLILLVCLIGVGSGGYIGINGEKKYTSAVVFKMSNTSTPSIQGNLGALSGLVGIKDSSGSAAKHIKDKVRGRVFIESLDEELDFFSDYYLNKYNPNRKKDPLWKATLKQLLGYQNIMPDPVEAAWQGIVRQFNNNLEINVSRNETINIRIYHNNAKRASKIANTIMYRVLQDDRDSKELKANFQINFLTNAVADSLTELELAQSDLQTFAIKNTAVPEENFKLVSVELQVLRDLLDRNNELLNAATALELVLNKKIPINSDYLQLVKNFPVVDQVDFRRALGLSEFISSWSWPEKSTVTAVMGTLLDRSKKLKIEIESAKKDIELVTADLAYFAKLKRDETIAKARYTVLINQVESTSLTEGIRADNSVIFEKALTPMFPSEPRRDLYIVLGALIGLIIGVSLSFLIAFQQKVYFSKNRLIDDAEAHYVANTRKLKFLRKLTLEQIKKKIINKPQAILRELVLEIHKSSKTFVVVSSLRSKFKSTSLAYMAASYMQHDDIKIAIINFSKKNRSRKLDIDTDKSKIFISVENDGNISLLEPKGYLNPLDFLSQHKFFIHMKELSEKYDLIFLCADDKDSLSVGRAMQFQEVFHVMSVRTKHTKIESLTQICKTLPIQGLLHD